jgi:hypothetical protein
VSGVSSQDFEELNDAWASELQHYAPLTVENAPDGFVERVMARIGEVENFTVVTTPQVPASRRTGGRIRRIFPIAATAAVLLLFAMPALQRSGFTSRSVPEAAAPSALESAEAPKMAARPAGDAQSDGDNTDGAETEKVTSFGTTSTDEAAPEENISPEASPIESGEAVNGLPTPFKSSLSRGCGGFIDADERQDYCLLYGATGRPAGIAFCVILEGGTPPEDVLPVVPGQYLISPEQLEALLPLQPEGVEPQYIEEGLTPSATVGLVIIKQLPSDN